MERLAEAKPPVEDKTAYLRELTNGFERGQIFLTALELDVFSNLQTPLSAEALAEKLETKAALTMRFLDVLTGLKLLVKNNGMYCTAPDMAPFLVQGSPLFARYLTFDVKARDVWIRMKDILQNGPAGESDEHERYQDQQDTRQWIDWMASGSLLGRLQGVVRQLKELPEFAGARKLIDLGGGHGLFGIAFAQENPHLQVVIFDKPEVTPLTQTYIDRYGMGDRVSTLSGDYTADELGEDYDIVFEACSFCGNDQDYGSFYQRVRRVLKDNGLFVRLTFTLDDHRTGPLLSLVWDLRDHLSGHKKMPMRANTEIFQLLADAGLTGEQVIDMSTSCSIPMRMIIARKSPPCKAPLYCHKPEDEGKGPVGAEQLDGRQPRAHHCPEA
jgi:predicted O-methyltransferase YrrM